MSYFDKSEMKGTFCKQEPKFTLRTKTNRLDGLFYPTCISICNPMGPRAIKDKFHAYIFNVFTKFGNFENTSEINPLLPEGTCDYVFNT